jgi:3-hydroxybutyryl-CoA dehydrogenase
MRVGVIGGGLMGSGIAEVCARSGVDVTVVEVDEERMDQTRAKIDKSLDRAASAGRLEANDRSAAGDRLAYTTSLEDLEGADAAIEAIIEDEQTKRDLFLKLDEVLPDAEFLASNTSSVPIMKLAAGTSRPERVVGLHFFNPVPVMRLVELIPSIVTSAEVADRAEDFMVDGLGKRVIRSQDRAGFIVNALFVPYVLAAIRMLESGFASADDIDAGMVEGCSHPMGPLALADMIGLDTIEAVADSMYAEFKEPLYAPPPLLSRMVEAGLLGRKVGRGFFNYTK